MNLISFDNNLDCRILIPSKSYKISYLTNLLFSNTAEALKKDIENCQDKAQKSILEHFLKDVENGRFSFMDYEYVTQEPDEGIDNMNVGDNIEILGDDRNEGNWMAIVHRVYAEHSGFWYAAMNIEHEIKNIEDKIHILQGYIVFADNIDELIALIKQSDCQENIFEELFSRGLSNRQARAIVETRLTSIARLDKDSITSDINDLTHLIEILREYV